MDVQTAVTVAKKCRPIIDPIGQLPEFLHRLHTTYQRMGGAPGSQFASAGAQPAQPEVPDAHDDVDDAAPVSHEQVSPRETMTEEQS